jgi:hypothetical protein
MVLVDRALEPERCGVQGFMGVSADDNMDEPGSIGSRKYAVNLTRVHLLKPMSSANSRHFQ